MVTMRLLGLVFIAACLVVLPASAQAAAPGLIASYGFEESSGASAVDSSGSANTGTLAGPTRSTAGRFGGSLSFDGVNDVVNVNDSASLDLSTAMTLEAWVNPSQSSGSWRTVVIKEKPSALAYALYAGEDSGKPSAHVSTNNREFDTRGPSNTALNVWTHLAATYDRATLRLYVNGTQVASRAVSGSLDVTTSPLRIGGNTVWGEYFKGLIDEVRVYNRALTAGEIQADMSTPIVAADTQPPSVPAGVTATVDGDDVDVEWQASTDDVGVAGYRVYRDGELIATTTFLGRADADRPVGTYRYRVLAFDAAGNESALSAEATATVAPDTTPPTITIENPPEGAVLKSVNTTARASGSDDIVSVQYKLNGSSVGAPATGYPWLRALDVRWDFPDGPYELTAEARDAAGNVGVSLPVNVTVANGAPASAQFTAPADGATVSGIVNVEADIAGGIVTDVIFRVDGTRVRQENAQPHFTYAWDSSTVAPGTHTLRVEAADDHYVPLAYDEITVTVAPDTTPPSLTLDGACPRSVERITRFSGTVSDDRDSSPSVQLRLDGASIPAYAWQNGGAGSGQYAKDWDTWYTPNGAHTITVVASDAAGNTASVDCDVTVDNIPLEVGFTNVTDGGTVPAGLTPITADQLGGAACGCWVKIKIDGVEKVLESSPPATYQWNTPAVGTVHTLTAELIPNYPNDPPYKVTTIHVTIAPPTPVLSASVSDGEAVLSWNGPVNGARYRIHRSTTPGFTPGSENLIATTGTPGYRDPAGTGTWHYRVVATDTSGGVEQTSNEVSVTIAPDTTPPYSVNVRLATGTLDCDRLVSGVVKLQAGALDDRVVTYLQIKIDGVDLGPPAPLRIATADWDTTLYPDGPHVATAVARDQDGNEATSPPCNFTVDNSESAPPTVSLTAPAGGATVSGTVAVKADATDDRAITSVQFKLDGNNLGTADTTSPYSVNWNTTTATKGTHTLTAVATDDDGHSTTSEPVTVTVNNAIPGLMAAYGFNEDSGTTVADSSGNNLGGTLSGATQTASGKFGRALSFDGVNDSVIVPSASSLDLTTGMTLAAWVKPTAISGSWRTVMLKERTGGLTYALYAGGDVPRPSVNVRAGGPEVNAIGPSQLPLNAWSHLAATYDSIALRLYVNGTQVATAPLTSPILSSTGALKIGGNAVWGEWFKGAIDEVRVYDRALSAAEIVADRDTAVG